MNSGKPEDRFVVADQPANRRTAPVAAPRPQALNPVAQQRARKALSRSRLGEPLAFALRPALPAHSPRVPALAIAAFVAATAALPFAVLGTSTGAKLAAGGTALVLGGAGWWQTRQSRRALLAQQGLAADDGAAWADPAVLARLDGALEAAAAELPDAALSPLVSLKATLLRVLRLLPQAGTNESFTIDDRLYVVECMRRYLPDSLEAYLRVPSLNRGVPLEDGRSATEVFIAQLGLLQQELERREQKGAVAAADGLMQQQRFLQAKSGR